MGSRQPVLIQKPLALKLEHFSHIFRDVLHYQVPLKLDFFRQKPEITSSQSVWIHELIRPSVSPPEFFAILLFKFETNLLTSRELC